MGADAVRGPAIVHLVGYPGVGKFTVANEMASLASDSGSQWVVVDNHLTSNVIFSVLPVDGIRPLPPTVWDRVGEVREALMRTIEELAPPDWSFVFTNVLIEGVPDDVRLVERLVELADRRASRYVPVRLSCATDELVRRVPRPDREQRQKWIDPDAVRAFVETTELLDIRQPTRIDVDVTTTTPNEVAAWILDHVTSLADGRSPARRPGT